MEGSWHVVLRDIMVILSATVLILVSIFTALIAWRLYRLVLKMREEVQPIIGAVRQTADTVRDATDFMGGGAVSPAVTAVGVVSGAYEAFQLLQRFYRGLRRDKGESGGS